VRDFRRRAASWRRAPWGARRVHLRDQGRALGLRFRETRRATRTPFRRIGSHALAALGLPESSSPHPSGCDPDEACARSVSLACLRERRRVVGPRAPLSLVIRRRGARRRAAASSFELGRACPRAPDWRARASRSRDASDRLLHSETSRLEHSCFVASQRSGPWIRAAPFGAARRIALVPRRSPRARPRSVDCAPCRPSGDGSAGRGWLGATPCERGRGAARFTARRPLRRPCDARVAASSSAPRARKAASGTSVAFPRALARRRPRPVPREPRERRALPRSEVPSIGSCVARAARTEVRASHAARVDPSALT